MRERGGRTLPFLFRSEDQAVHTIGRDDLRRYELVERRALLRKFVKGAEAVILFSDHMTGADGEPMCRGRSSRVSAGAAAGWPLPHDYRLAAKRGRNPGRPALRRPALKTSRCDGSCTAGNGKASIENFGKSRVSSAPASRAPSVSWR